MKYNKSLATFSIIAGFFSSLFFTACEKGESYADLLKKEEKAVNWYVSGFWVEDEIPADSVFISGEDAPFYKMNEDGSVYMKVIDAGDIGDKPQKGDRVYFRYSRMDLRNFYEAGLEQWIGNSSDLNAAHEKGAALDLRKRVRQNDLLRAAGKSIAAQTFHAPGNDYFGEPVSAAESVRTDLPHTLRDLI